MTADGRRLGSLELESLDHPALTVVDFLARLSLVARRLGAEAIIHDASPDIFELLELAGLQAHFSLSMSRDEAEARTGETGARDQEEPGKNSYP